MYAFLLRPKWIVSHVFVVVLIATMVFMGFWQLDRLDSRRSLNDEIEARQALAAVEIDVVASPLDDYSVGDDVRFRPARASGEYVTEDEVLVLNRTFEGQPGYWVLTPLMVDADTAVIVNRGWIPFRYGPGEPRSETAAPQGEVSVQGFVRESSVAEGLQNADPVEGVLDALARPDLERYQQQLSYDIYPVYLQAQLEGTTDGGAVTSSTGGGLPIRLPVPDLDDGPHLSYAAQWFIFSTIGVIGYPLVLRRIARSEGKDGRHSDIPVEYL
jgi:surfeit locus 1 family protein